MRKNSESGYILVTVAALLFVLVGFTALAVDMGTVLSSRTQLQRAADAAALAGAFVFAQNPNATETMAKDRAKAVLGSNKDMGDAIDTSTGVTVDVKCPTCSTPYSANQVSVKVERTESTVFAQLLGVAGVANTVSAVAELGTGANGASCIKPWFLPNTIADTADDPCTANQKGYLLVSNKQVTQFAKNNFGSQLIAKPQDPSSALQPGQFYEIDMAKYSANGGAKTYTGAITGCNTYQFQCQNWYDTLSGNKKGPTAAGVCSLVSGDPKCQGSADTFVGPGQYDWADGSGIHDTSKSLVIAPIVDLTAISGFCPTNTIPNGAQVPVVGFASVFLGSADPKKDSISAYIVNIWACGPNSGTDTSNSGFPVPLQLVRAQ